MRTAYNRRVHRCIWRLTHFRFNVGVNALPLWVVTAVREHDGLVVTFRIREFRGAELAPNETSELVHVWRSLLFFAIPGFGFLVANVWTRTARRIRCPNARAANVFVLRRGLRVYEDPNDEDHYIVDFISALDNPITLSRNMSRNPLFALILECAQVFELTAEEIDHRSRFFIGLNHPRGGFVFTQRAGNPVFLRIPPPLLFPIPPPPGSHNLLVHSHDSYTAYVELFGPPMNPNRMLRRISLFRLRPDLDQWELVSIVPFHLLPAAVLNIRTFHLVLSSPFVNLSVAVRAVGGTWAYLIFRYCTTSRAWAFLPSQFDVFASLASVTFCCPMFISPN